MEQFLLLISALFLLGFAGQVSLQPLAKELVLVADLPVHGKAAMMDLAKGTAWFG